MYINEVEEMVIDNIDSIQKSIVDAGGRFFTKREIEIMPVGQLLRIVLPNHIKVTFEFKQDQNGTTID